MWSRAKEFLRACMTQEDSQTESGERFLATFDLLEGTSEATRAKTAETFLELLGARVRNPNTRSAYRVAWRSFLAFCSARQLEWLRISSNLSKTFGLPPDGSTWRPPKRLSDPLTWNFGSALRLANYWPRSAKPPPKRRHESLLS
jgi:hypothetical protein